MDDLDIDSQVEQIYKQAEANVEKTAQYFASLLKAALPTSKSGKSKGTAGKVAVKKTGRFSRDVEVPFPWRFIEYGTVNIKANPIVRKTLFANQQALEDMLGGNE